MKIIYTKKNEEIFMDDEDYEWLNQYTWHVNQEYACRNVLVGDKIGAQLSMHRMIMDAKKGEVVDHINHNKIDNRKQNLRVCTYEDNSRNQSLRKNNKSGINGVHWHKNVKRWMAKIQHEGKPVSLGSFVKIEDAIVARKEAEIKYYGEFSNKNIQIDKENLEKSYKKEVIAKSPIDYKYSKETLSGVVGVCYLKNSNKWVSHITINKNRIHLGTFNDIEGAIESRKEAELKYYGRTAEDKNIEQC